MEEVDIYQLQIIEAALKHYKVHLAEIDTSENDSESSNQFDEIEQFILPKLQTVIQAAQDGKLDQLKEEPQGAAAFQPGPVVLADWESAITEGEASDEEE